MIRSGNSHWNGELNLSFSSVPAGTYYLFVYSVEDDHPVTFNLSINGQAGLYNHNTGPAGSWKKLGPFQTTLPAGTTGTISINCQGLGAILSGVEIWQAPPSEQSGQVSITSPAAGSSFLTGQALMLSSYGTDPNGVAKVSFYHGSTLIGENTGTPFSVRWDMTGYAPGSYSLSARLTDNLGNVTVSAPVSVELSAPAPGSITFYRAINLNGTRTVIDNYPYGGSSAPDYNHSPDAKALTYPWGTLLPATDPAKEAMIRSSLTRYTDLQVNLTSVPAGTCVYLYVWEEDMPETFSLLLGRRDGAERLQPGLRAEVGKAGTLPEDDHRRDAESLDPGRLYQLFGRRGLAGARRQPAGHGSPDCTGGEFLHHRRSDGNPVG